MLTLVDEIRSGGPVEHEARSRIARAARGLGLQLVELAARVVAGPEAAGGAGGGIMARI